MGKEPKKILGDVAHTIARAGLSAIPVVGGPASVLFSELITPPLVRRRDKWIESIGEGLKKLEEKVENFNIEELKDNEMFITTVMHATQVAIRNHQKEKLEALRAAVLNSTSLNAPEEDLQLMFLNWIDELTPWHLRILKFFEEPMAFVLKNRTTIPNRTMGAPANTLELVFPELRGQSYFYDQIFKDLSSKGLTNIESLQVTMTGKEMYASHTTKIAKQFIGFITSPIKDEK